MNSIYNWLQFIHVAAAMVWLGGSVALTVLNARLTGRLDHDGTAALATQSRTLGSRLFGPAAIVTLLAGLGMVAVADMGGQLWVTWGMGVVLASLILSVVFTRRFAHRLGQLAVDPDPDLEIMAGLRTRLGVTNALNLLLLLSAVWAMVVKPV